MEADDSDSTDTDKRITFVEHCLDVTSDKEEIRLDLYTKDALIGYLNAIIIYVGNLKKGGFSHDKLKCQDKEVEEELIAFYSQLQESLSMHSIFYITDFFLEGMYRGAGLGGDVLDLVPD